MQFDNSTNRFGSAVWPPLHEVKHSGLLAGSGHLVGHLDGHALTLDTDAPLLTISGSGGGKTSQILTSAILKNAAQPRMVLDPRGEIISVTLPAFATVGTYAWIWNPTGMHGLASHAVQCLDILELDAPSFHADCDFIAASLIPISGSSSGKYFELRSREWLKNIMKALVERDGFVSFPSLWHAISSIEGDTARWADLVEFMLVSSMEGVRRTAGEMLAKQQDSPREFGGVMGELYSYLSFLDDPMLQAALDRSDFALAKLCDAARPASVFIVVPVAYIPIWAPVLRTMFAVLMLYKSRAVSAPRIQLMVDEAGQLGHFDALVRAMTYGRGDGVSAWPFFQDTGQILRHYAYYRCETRGCPQKSKSVPRAKLEGGFEELLKSLQPSKQLFALAKAMISDAWNMRLDQARMERDEWCKQLKAMEARIDDLLDRIVEAKSPSVIAAYEKRIEKLERDKLVLAEKAEKPLPNEGRLEECIELSLKFLARPWEIYKNGTYAVRQTVLRLAFSKPLTYSPEGVYGTPKTTLPFKVLGGLDNEKCEMVL